MGRMAENKGKVMLSRQRGWFTWRILPQAY